MTAPTTTRADLRRQLLDALAAVDPRDTTWRDEAACRGTETETFFPETYGAGHVAEALRICRHCPVKTPCLRIALDLAPDRISHNDGDSGVFGGTTPRQRRRIRKAWEQRKGTGA